MTQRPANAKITGVGCYVPENILSNKDLERIVDTSDEWIMSRTGIEKRHIAKDGETTSDLATKAAAAVLEETGVAATDVEAILVCTVTPDMLFPATACLVQDKIGAKGAWGFDLVAACSGLLYGLSTGAQLVSSGSHKRVLVIGADTMSRIIDYEDRSTCVLFGDGAGAFMLEAAPNGDGGLIDFINEVDGSGGQYLCMPAGGSAKPATHDTVDARLHFVHQDGRQVYRYAVHKMVELCEAVLKRNGFTINDIDLFVPHQANRRIIVAAAERMGLPIEKAMINIGQYGNTTGGTIPLATRDALNSGRLKKGDLVLMAAVGAGFTAGVSLWRWTYGP
ncbi:MAG: ketoacyl-ACP synthase III [Bryobacterales bacterium]|nr:ketoacyl-ACP synthase III [Bryobacterales bacterium]